MQHRTGWVERRINGNAGKWEQHLIAFSFAFCFKLQIKIRLLQNKFFCLNTSAKYFCLIHEIALSHYTYAQLNNNQFKKYERGQFELELGYDATNISDVNNTYQICLTILECDLDGFCLKYFFFCKLSNHHRHAELSMRYV